MGKKTNRKLYIIGAINEELYIKFSEELRQLENESDKEIEVELNSPGGITIDALAFAARIRLSSCPIQVTVYGIAASAAIIILASADYRRMTKESWVMVHEDSNKLKGKVTDLENEVSIMRRFEDQWSNLLEEYTNTNAVTWATLHSKETYLNAKECLELGLIEEII
jgi:ATP-dependent Clp protease protease subunit